jgi:hypothetical protein
MGLPGLGGELCPPKFVFDRSSMLPEAISLARRGAASIPIDFPANRPNAPQAKTSEQGLALWLQDAVAIRRAATVTERLPRNVRPYLRNRVRSCGVHAMAEDGEGTLWHEGFQPLALWSLSNAFISGFEPLAPIPQFRATARLAAFLERHHSSGSTSGRRSRQQHLHRPRASLTPESRFVILHAKARWVLHLPLGLSDL